MKQNNKKTFVYQIIAVLLASALLLASCGGDAEQAELPSSPFAGRDAVDMSSYKGLGDYDKELRFADTTVAEIDQLMKDKESFIFIAAYEDCDYCSAIIPYLNDALTEADTYAGYLDTRKDPEWMNNADIDDYELFVERFGRYLEEDENGNRHLYTPDLYVIKNGKVKAHHQGVVDGFDDPESPLTSAQEDELKTLLKDMIGVRK